MYLLNFDLTGQPIYRLHDYIYIYDFIIYIEKNHLFIPFLYYSSFLTWDIFEYSKKKKKSLILHLCTC